METQIRQKHLRADDVRQRTMKEALVGTWKLVSAKETVDGESRDAFGRAPTGFLTYTNDDRMMGMISHGERKPLSIPDYVGAPPSERAEAFATFLAYAGTYKLEGSRVIHHVEASWLENSVGTEQVRRIVKLEGDQLLLRTPPYLKGGRMVTAELLWQRVKGAAADQ
jgi:lipocalin-like protein